MRLNVGGLKNGHYYSINEEGEYCCIALFRTDKMYAVMQGVEEYPLIVSDEEYVFEEVNPVGDIYW